MLPFMQYLGNEVGEEQLELLISSTAHSLQGVLAGVRR